MNNIAKRRKLIVNAFILTLTTVTLGFINTAYRVYLSNKIGPEGMGLFQLIMSIYIMTITIAISGIRVTTTRLIAEEIGRGNNKNISTIMRKALVYSIIFSVSSALLLNYGAEFISMNFLKDERAIIPLQILSFSLPFIGLSACFHGYFYGMRKIIKSITTDIIEVGAMMLIVVTFLSSTLPKGLSYTCILIAIATSVSDILSAFYAYILYIFENKNSNKNYNIKNSSHTLWSVTRISFPIACSSYIQNGLKTVEDVLIPNALRQFGSSNSASLSIFGMIKGMVLPILYFPAIFLASFSTLIIPEISEAKALNNPARINNILSRVIKFTLLIAIFSSGIFIIFEKEFGLTLYNSEEVGNLMRIFAPLIPFMYLDRVMDASLNALDQQMSTLRYNLIDMGVRIILIIFLIPKMGINGFILVLFIGTLLNSLLSINRLLKVTKLEFLLFDWIIKPSFCVTLSSYIIKSIFDSSKITTLFTLQLFLVFIIYFILLICIRCIKNQDIMWFVDAFRKDIKSEKITDLGISKRF